MAFSRYLTPGQEHHGLGLVCLGVGTQQGRLRSCGPRVLDSYASVFVTAGQGTLRTPHGQVPVGAPTLFWLTPGVPHEYGPDDGGWQETWALFAGPAASAYAGLGLVGGAAPVPVADVNRVRGSFGRLLGVCRRGGPYLHAEAGAILHELIMTVHHARADRDQDSEPVLATLHRDAALPLTVAQHARRIGMPVGVLRETVRRSTGHGPREYLTRSRLDAAKELLATTDLPVAAVGRRVGFADPAYFTRVFVRHTGMSPSVFRDRQQR